MTTTWNRIQEVAKDGLGPVFLRVLGWSAPSAQPMQTTIIGPITWHVNVIAQLHGAAVLEIPDLTTPKADEHRRLGRYASKYFPDHVLVFRGQEFDFWYWPRRLPSGGMSLEALRVPAKTIPEFLAQRLAGLQFTKKELENGLTAAAVRDKLRGTMETAKITADFYKKFKNQHESLSKSIQGLNEDLAHGYATLLLNRLMFIWFLQRKEFLNNDPNYLQTCFAKIKELSGPNKFYSFYKDYLLDLFFNYLNAKDRDSVDPKLAEVIGDIPYINGGIFGESEVEAGNQIDVPDSAFESIFAFFSSFTWHLDTRPTGDPREINPEVIGYIFEQYINYTADGKKDNGAYYTQSDVTGYMVSQTLIPAIFDRLETRQVDLISRVSLNPLSYINEELLHGSDGNKEVLGWLPIDPALVKIWGDDPIHWSVLDEAEPDPAVQLPDETWVETFARRERVEELFQGLLNGVAQTPNDLITHNLNGTRLLLDGLSELDDASLAVDIFDDISTISVLDPTCGSGAFLFAALAALEPVMHLLLERILELGLPKDANPTVIRISSARNRNYAVRKHIALSNLHGTDIMPDAIETAKLRIFLALAATLTERSELEPLPDLDFNLKCGNLVVGFANDADVHRLDGDLFLQREISGLQPEINHFQAEIDAFQLRQANGDPAVAVKAELNQRIAKLTGQLNRIYADAARVPAEEFEGWVNGARPFHWLLQFPEVMRGGGFDVIIGNPPYVKMSLIPARETAGYATADAPDFYAVCYERSLQLLKPSARHAFIVMLSLAFSSRFASLRQQFATRQKSEWWSTYGAWPIQLFPGVRVRNTMLVLGPGNSKLTTRHHIMTSGTRKWQFACIEYFGAKREGGSPIQRAGVAQELLQSISKFGISGQVSGKEIKCRGTGAYWFPVFFDTPPALDSKFEVLELDDGLTKSIPLVIGEDPVTSAAALAGKLGYLVWQATGDDLNVLPSQTVHLRGFVMSNSNESLVESAVSVLNASKGKYFMSNNAGKNFLGIRWNQLREVTDNFDRQLLSSAGLSHHWRDLNIWYRQTMRATRENLNSTRVPESVVERIWPGSF